MKYTIFLILSLIGANLLSQNKRIDSLTTSISILKEDTNKVKSLVELSKQYTLSGLHEKSINIATLALELSEKLHYKRGIANSLNNIGNAYIYKEDHDYDKALQFQLQSLKIREEIKDKNGIAISLNNIGAIYKERLDYPKALDYLFKGLKIREELKDKKGISASLGNIGAIYESVFEYDKALDYCKRSLRIKEEIGDKSEIINTLSRMGRIYSQIFEYNKALECHFQSYKVSEELSDKKKMASILNSIGDTYYHMKDYDKALEYTTKSLKIREEIGNKRFIAASEGSISRIYLTLENYSLAKEYALKALKTFKGSPYIIDEREIQRQLYEISKAMGNSVEALEYHEQFVLLSDSILKTDNKKSIMQKELNYEFEKKEALLKLEQEKKEIEYLADAKRKKLEFEHKQEQQRLKAEQEKKELSYQENLKRTKLTDEFNQRKAFEKAEQEKRDISFSAQNKQQKIIIYAVVFGLLIVVFFSVFLYRRFKVTQKQKSIIEKQKHLVEGHQKEIIDSITYAKRLQEAILPPLNLIYETLPNSFILYKPKDIVAGDFYWMHRVTDVIFVAAADCTGHGVPGAMVSVVCSNALNRAVNEFGNLDTAKILDKTRELVLETFSKSGEEIKDGMDISLVSINVKTNVVNWSGANNPLWYLQDNEVKEIKADKQPIGKTDNPKPYTTHVLNLNKGDSIYLITDGFADQFGGPKGKKYKYKQLEEVILNSSSLQLKEQKIKLEESFNNWIGDLEQVDDVTIIGIRL